MIVTVLSRKAFAELDKLTPTSSCDNVLLEFDLALHLVVRPSPPLADIVLVHPMPHVFGLR